MNTADYACRSCGSKKIRLVLDLGKTPLANSLLSEEGLSATEEYFPLNLVFCEDCTLLQIDETVDPEKLFSNYLYFSSFSDTMLAHSKELAGKVVEKYNLDGNSLVMEIASNDGYLLQYYKELGVPVLGIEPAKNVAKVANEKGIETIAEFFNEEVGMRLADSGRRADIMHANNVLAHVADLNGVVAGFENVLSDKGVVISESPYLKHFIDNCEFDTVYHEHLCYYSLTALSNLFDRHGLEIYDAEEIPIHGGSMRVYACRKSAYEKTERLEALLEAERKWPVDKFGYYEKFGEKVSAIKEELTSCLSKLKGEGARIAAYGASAKGSTLLNYCGIGSSLLDYVVDRSTVKQGLYTPGTHLPIYAPERLLEDQPDYVLLLTWNFADEILKQQAAFRERGGRFIVPIPGVKIV